MNRTSTCGGFPQAGGAAVRDAACDQAGARDDARAESERGGEAICERFARVHSQGSTDDLAAEVRIEPGAVSDYHHLSRFHYRAAHCGVVTSVLRMVSERSTVTGRYTGEGMERTVVGVLVRGLPALGCQLRDVATNRRYRGLGAAGSAKMLNREVRTITRVVVDPRWRGLGLAVKLVRAALENPEAGVVYTEALAAMGRVSPFFERAGMQRYDRARLPAAARMLDVLFDLQIPPFELACAGLMEQRMARLDDTRRSWLMHELKRWHRQTFRTAKRELEEMEVRVLVGDARDNLLFQPVYYLYRHGENEGCGCSGRSKGT